MEEFHVVTVVVGGVFSLLLLLLLFYFFFFFFFFKLQVASSVQTVSCSWNSQTGSSRELS